MAKQLRKIAPGLPGGCCTRTAPRKLSGAGGGSAGLKINHRRPGIAVRRQPIIPIPGRPGSK